MKKLFLSLLLLLTVTVVWAQVPQQISYQSLIRDGNNVVVASSPIGIKISLLQGTATGPAVYVETHSKTTNANGLVSLEIGTGTVLSGSFASIDWANGPYLIQTETDPTGGVNYSIPVVMALNSVPYALFAANGTAGPKGDKGDTGATGAKGDAGAQGATGAAGPQGLTGPAGTKGTNGAQGPIGLTGAAGAKGDKGDIGATGATGVAGAAGPKGDTGAAGTQGVAGPAGGFTHYLGELFNGGIIYYLYIGSDGLEHGLIVALTESSNTWQRSRTTTGANRTEDGAYNTNLMTDSPAAEYVASLGSGWYLPSIDELNLLFNNRFTVQKALRAGNNTLIEYTFLYWSSTEFSVNNAFVYNFGNGYGTNVSKHSGYAVRGVKSF